MQVDTVKEENGILAPLNLEITFPPLSKTVTEVTQLLEDKRSVPDIEKLIEIVHRDPQVVAAVLRRINSAYYGMRRRFDDIRKAVLMIGFLDVSNIVLTSGYAGLRRNLPSPECESTYNHILRLSISTAFLAQKIADRLNLPERKTSFTSGLLHTAGRLVLLFNKPHAYSSLWQIEDALNVPTASDETELLGVQNAALCAAAMEHWNLPESISLIISNHQSPQSLKGSVFHQATLALNASMGIAEQLIHFPLHVPQQEDDVEEGKSEEEATKAEQAEETAPTPDYSKLTFPESLERLAKLRNEPPRTLESYVVDSLSETQAYTSEMMV